MIKLHELKPHPKSRRRRKTVGRGLGSSHGTYSGRGAKGQKARTGGKIRAGFEGGRMPLIRQVPKMRGKGFQGDMTEIEEVSLTELSSHFGDNDTVDVQAIVERGLAESGNKIKILGNGKLEGRKLNIKGIPITKSAKAEIEKAGGTINNDNDNNNNKNHS